MKQDGSARSTPKRPVKQEQRLVQGRLRKMFSFCDASHLTVFRAFWDAIGIWILSYVIVVAESMSHSWVT
ncbi:hypothetical protein N7462_009753 [Penicillium macrosclerotiorum]|uniref:uncharacterized protein n=1 Tax=Penicillium macrosclerotiorum TaxID=303699 RepID=UPI002547EBE6|nr:uncharacterized protein N7462_009753 [Penicillium macrosclerotiorum]KAJ5668683.1 hypothetical protein N7462_009753 [Penicillium macrosclerotiorum]